MKKCKSINSIHEIGKEYFWKSLYNVPREPEDEEWEIEKLEEERRRKRAIINNNTKEKGDGQTNGGLESLDTKKHRIMMRTHQHHKKMVLSFCECVCVCVIL